MIRGMESVLLFSENAKKLAGFYRDVVGLKVDFEGVMEKNEEIYSFALKNCYLNILDHSEIHGKAKDPKRFIINFEVDDIEKEVKRLKRKKVKVVQDIYHVEGYGFIATLTDIDGNLFQLVQTKGGKTPSTFTKH